MPGKETGRCLAHCLPLNHAKAVFLVDIDSGQRRVQGSRGPLVVDDLVENGEGFGTTLGSNSELSHCCREISNFTFTEREEPPRDVFPQEFAHLVGPDLFRIDSLLVVHDTVFQDVDGDFLRFRQRSDPLVIIKLLRGWVLFPSSRR